MGVEGMVECDGVRQGGCGGDVVDLGRDGVLRAFSFVRYPLPFLLFVALALQVFGGCFGVRIDRYPPACS